jgi:predicted nuclease of predicted toxin-antitoxin system
VKLLFDENVSPNLVGLVRDEYPGSTHVRDVGLRGATDRRIWEHARANGFVIVSKDDDFRQRSLLEGAPPKVVWLQIGNAGTAQIAELLREQAPRLRRFEDEEESAFLIISLTRRAV